MIKAVELRKGRACLYEDQIYICHECQHVAKGNKRSYMQAKLKNFKSGQIIDVRFRVDDMLEVPFLESKDYEYLTDTSEAMIYLAMIHLMVRRLAQEPKRE